MDRLCLLTSQPVQSLSHTMSGLSWKTELRKFLPVLDFKSSVLVCHKLTCFNPIDTMSLPKLVAGTKTMSSPLADTLTPSAPVPVSTTMDPAQSVSLKLPSSFLNSPSTTLSDSFSGQLKNLVYSVPLHMLRGSLQKSKTRLLSISTLT